MPAEIARPQIVSFVGSSSGADVQKSDSIQLEQGGQVTLSWMAAGADGVELEGNGPLQRLGASGSVTVSPKGPLQRYSLVALAGAVRSEPEIVHVSTHAPGQIVSAHAAVRSPRVVVWLALQDDSLAPRANVPFTITSGDSKQDGTTSAEGELKVTLPPGSEEALLTLHGEHDERFQLDLSGSAAPGAVTETTS